MAGKTICVDRVGEAEEQTVFLFLIFLLQIFKGLTKLVIVFSQKLQETKSHKKDFHNKINSFVLVKFCSENYYIFFYEAAFKLSASSKLISSKVLLTLIL